MNPPTHIVPIGKAPSNLVNQAPVYERARKQKRKQQRHRKGAKEGCVKWL